MEQGFQFADELGPAKIIHIHEPRTGLKAVPKDAGGKVCDFHQGG